MGHRRNDLIDLILVRLGVSTLRMNNVALEKFRHTV